MNKIIPKTAVKVHYQKERCKDSNYIPHANRLVGIVQNAPMTRLMISRATGIAINTLDWWLDRERKEGRMVVLFREKCRISNVKANYYSTNPMHIKGHFNQLKFPFI